VHAPGTRCCGERLQEWCRVLYRKFSPAWSMPKMTPGFGSSWNKVWYYPQHETFHQFLDALVVATLGKEWFEMQLLLPLKNQNEIVQMAQGDG